MAKKTTTTHKPQKASTKKGGPSKIGKLMSNFGSWKELLQGDTLRFVFGLLLLITALFMLLAFTSNFFTGHMDQAGCESGSLENAANYGGNLGARVAYYFMHDCFGACAFFIPIFMIFTSMKLMRAYKVRLWKWFLNCSILMVWGSITLSLIQNTLLSNAVDLPFPLGGGHGDYIYAELKKAIGTPMTYILMIASAICYLIYISRETINVVRKLLNPQDLIKKHLPHKDKSANGEEENTNNDHVVNEEEEESEHTPNDDMPVTVELSTETGNERDTALVLETPEVEAATPTDKTEASTPQPDFNIEAVNKEEEAGGKTVEDVSKLEPYDPRKDLEFYKFPHLDLLKKYGEDAPTVDMAEQNANRDRIISILRSFGVEIASIRATLGPTITLYEITPASGVRISKIRNLEDDIALSLSALGIRIIAPIPGKGTIGIEVPNKNPRIVSMESILNSKKFQETTFDLPIALGKTITNEVFMVDLAKMPHLLVAGATGQGKSVGLNAIISSLLYKKHPAELKFVMVDPKKVEFSMYSPLLHHFLAKIPGDDDAIITDVTKVVQTLKSLCQVMDSRYDLLKAARAKNIKEYNAKFKARQLNPEKGHEFMPYIVVIIDEFGDLIMTAGKEIELPIARIAQLARAVGIHMVIATQRPTTNIITGTIKANFPARMAFRVSASVDSKTILDRPGAHQLIGRGDMLFLAGSDPVRVQCAFVDTPEIEDINAFIGTQQGYLTPYELPEVMAEGDNEGGSKDIDMNNLDPMFAEAARLIVIHQQGSTSLIQRKFAIGYNRAGRLMDQLERAGVVGPAQGSKPREVLCADELALENLLSGLM